LRKEGIIVQLTVDKSSVVGYLPNNNDVTMEDEESPVKIRYQEMYSENITEE
jgi:hypothetical protein